MAPLAPHWQQPSHPDVQEVIVNDDAAFASKSLSKISVAPFGLFAKMDFPPCTRAAEPTYATVQSDRNSHLNLNSDLIYINHSCQPSLIFDMPSLSILAGPHGLRPGDELTFFYPSTEWAMAQGFDCFCGTPSCRKRIDGAGSMRADDLKGFWLNGYIRDLLAEKAAADACNTVGDTPEVNGDEDAVEYALRMLVEQAKASAKLAADSLASYSAAKAVRRISLPQDAATYAPVLPESAGAQYAGTHVSGVER